MANKTISVQIRENQHPSYTEFTFVLELDGKGEQEYAGGWDEEWEAKEEASATINGIIADSLGSDGSSDDVTPEMVLAARAEYIENWTFVLLKRE
jgi:hypothetical protein